MTGENLHHFHFTAGCLHGPLLQIRRNESARGAIHACCVEGIGARGISVTATVPGPMDTSFFYGQETPEAVTDHKSASALGHLTKIEDIVPLTKFLVTDGWWITGQTTFANDGYTTR